MNATADSSADRSRPATYEELSRLIDSSDEWAVGGLMKLYSYQEPDEQNIHSTVHKNECGFNAPDAEVLSDIAEFYGDKGFLTPRQLTFVKTALKKYVNQLLGIGVDPLPIKPYIAPVPKPVVMAASLLKRDDRPSGIKVIFSFPKGDNRFGEILGKIKTLPDRRFNSDNPSDKHWRIGLSLEAGKKLKEWGFEFSEGLQGWFDDLTRPVVPLDLTGLDPRLFPFQREGVAFIESRKGRALVGDEQGLGKTCEAVSWLKIHPELRPAIVVCPASLKWNWKKELVMWGLKDEKIQILSGRMNGDHFLWGQIIIVNYDILPNLMETIPNPQTQKKEKKEIPGTGWGDILINYNPKVVIYDEIHYLCNSQALRTKAGRKLAKKGDHVIGLSGTPIVNRPIEFFNPINMIRSDVFPSFWKFAHQFCGAQYNGFGWSFNGATNTEELHKLLIETILLRRLKKDVLKDLPDKIYSVVPFEITNRKEYDKAASDIISWISDNEGKEKADKASQAETLVEFEKLKQLAFKGKMEAIVEWISDFLESGEKMVVFTNHLAPLDFLQKAFPEISVRLDGGTKNRQEVVDRFQTDDKIKLFLGNEAAGVGITLTASSNVVHVEFPWTPGQYEQRTDRLHRIGQKDTVNVWNLVAQDTIEEDVAEILTAKAKVLASVLDGKEADEGSLISELIKKMKEEKRCVN